MSISLSGLASGIDTGEVIEQLLQHERAPIYRYEREISSINQVKDAWRDINTRMSTLEDKLSDLKLSATFSSRLASSSEESVATATAGNSVPEGFYELDITQIAEEHRIASDEQLDSTAELGLTGIIRINEQDVNLEGTFSLNDIRDTINNTEGVDVKASIINNTLVLEAADTGVENQIALEDLDGILENLGILNPDLSYGNELQEAQDVLLTINGIEISSSSNTIDQAVEGVTFNLHSAGTTIVEVSPDTEQAVEAVQAFVDQYNSLMDFIDSKTYYNTDNGSSGVLQGDSTVSRLETRIRQLVTDSISGNGEISHISQLGISIDRDGVMSLDSEKLEEALENNPEEAVSFFNAQEGEDGYSGMAVRLDSYLDQILQSSTGLIPRRLEYFDKQIKGLNESIVEVENRVEMTRERYIAQFAVMEEAILKMQQQQSWLMNQLDNLGGGNMSGFM